MLSLSKLVGAFCALFESDNVLADKREMSILYQMLTKAPETGLTPSASSLPWLLYSWKESHKPFNKAISSVHQNKKNDNKISYQPSLHNQIEMSPTTCH